MPRLTPITKREQVSGDAMTAFDAIIENCTRTIREELLPRIADGVYHWEDYIECDGVEAPKLHALRLTMTKTADKITLDFTGTDPEAKGPINWPIDYSDGKFFRKWVAPVLRSLAETPAGAPAGEDDYYVAMTTEYGPSPTFVYGTTGVISDPALGLVGAVGFSHRGHGP